jgi:TATA-binding protein-associated factor
MHLLILVRHGSYPHGGLLLISSGIGKTLQALVAVALAHSDRDAQRDAGVVTSPVSVVVCPSSVVGHWVSEIEKFFPGQSVFQPLCYAGSLSTRIELRLKEFSGCNIIVTSYSILRSDIDFLANFEWRCCILDEGHLLKNPKTATARASKRLRARHKVILTGTPVQNKVSEVWASFDFLMPNFLGSSACFSKDFARPIMNSQLPGASAETVKEGMTKLKLLHQQVLPFILRRDKDEVLRELPPKNVMVVRVPLSDLQKQIYQDFSSTSDARKSLASLEVAIGDDKKSDPKFDSNVMKSLIFLRLLCTHPSLVLPGQRHTGEQGDTWFTLNASGKMVALAQLLGEAGIIYDDKIMAADSDSSLLYCDEEAAAPDAYNDVISFNGNIVSRSGAENTLKASTKCLIFCQFTRTLDIVEELLFKQKMPSLRYLRLDGRVPAEQRAKMADAFNNDDTISVMLLTTRVGGLGLNLTGT